ncbi:MAG: glycosyltransferase family 2 protein [Patescibacteria group bacterium]
MVRLILRMQKRKPLVSILLPVHNSGEFLADCLESLVSQSFKNIEIVAIDDDSKDNSFKILKEFSKKYKKVRSYRNVKRYGIAVTLNRLLKKAKGDYIAFMDQDDTSSKRRIKKQLKFLVGNEGVAAVGSQCIFIDEKGKRLGKSLFPKENHLVYQSPLHGVSMQFETLLINKKLLPKDLLRFDTNSNPFIYSDIFMKLLPYGKFANLPDYLHYHRNSPKAYLSDLIRNPISFIKLWLRSILNYDYPLSLKTPFLPFVRELI